MSRAHQTLRENLFGSKAVENGANFEEQDFDRLLALHRYPPHVNLDTVDGYIRANGRNGTVKSVQLRLTGQY